MTKKKVIVLDGQSAKPVDEDKKLVTPMSHPSFIEFRFIEKDQKKHTMMIGLKHILPEDIIWRRDNPRVPSMICLQENNACDCPFNCMPKLAERCHFLFEQFDDLVQILIVFQREEKPLERRRPSSEYLRGVDANKVKTRVPRLFAVRVSRDFDIRIMRSNFDGLQVAMERTQKDFFEVPLKFWS